MPTVPLVSPPDSGSPTKDKAKALRVRNGEGARQTAIPSEPSLARDWLRPEEAEAWKDL